MPDYLMLPGKGFIVRITLEFIQITGGKRI